MSNPWFRFYSAALRDPKVAKLSDRDFRLWVTLLATASDNDGHLPPVNELKYMLNARIDHLTSGLERLMSARLIDALEHGYTPHHWNKFQYKSDTSTSRVQKHRERRNVSETPPEAETEQRQKKESAQQIEPRAAQGEPKLLDKLFLAAGIAGFREERHPGLLRVQSIRALLDRGYDLETDILPVIHEKARNKTFYSWDYFTPAIVECAAAKSAIRQRPPPQEENWTDRLAVWAESRTWQSGWGPRPNEPGCRAPTGIVSKEQTQ